MAGLTPLEKIEKIARKVYPPPNYCGTKKREARINRDGFVGQVLLNVMVDGLVINCKK